MDTNDVQTQTENNTQIKIYNTKITWPYVFKPFYTSVILIIFITYILESIRDDNKRLPSLEVMLLELSIYPINLVGQHLTTYLFILKCVNKNVGKKKRYLDIFSSAVIIRYLYFKNNITNDIKENIFVLRFIVHILTLSPMSEITLDCITMSINNQTDSYNKYYAPTDGAIRFGLANMLIASIEISRFIYSLYYVFKK